MQQLHILPTLIYVKPVYWLKMKMMIGGNDGWDQLQMRP